MNAILHTPQRLLLSVSTDELMGICNALNEVCHGIHIEDPEFQTRLGLPRSVLVNLLNDLRAGVQHPSRRVDERVAAWADGGSVQAICVTACGDPVDMGEDQARTFAEQLQEAIRKAD